MTPVPRPTEETLKAIRMACITWPADGNWDHLLERRGDITLLIEAYKEQKCRLEVAETALQQINEIRNSIVGLQQINWSEHIYPLVAALEEAGIRGAEYPEARAHFGSMLQRTIAMEERIRELEAALGAQEAKGDGESGSGC